jgi:hypothetical protein
VKRGERKGGGGWDLDVRLSGNRLRGEPCMPLMQNERVGGTGSKGERGRGERERERERGLSAGTKVQAVHPSLS